MSLLMLKNHALISIVHLLKTVMLHARYNVRNKTATQQILWKKIFKISPHAIFKVKLLNWNHKQDYTKSYTLMAC